MKSDFFTLRNRETGEVLEISSDPSSRSLFRFRRVCRGLDFVRSSLGWQLYFLTVTVSDEHVDAMNRDVGRFCNWLGQSFKRAGVAMKLVWVAEIQKKRYVRYSVKAPHWHFAVIAPDGSLPNVDYRDRAHHRGLYLKSDGVVISNDKLVERWGKGMVFCQVAWSPSVYGYLGKYFCKESERMSNHLAEWVGARRFGASRLGHFAWSEWAWFGVQERVSGARDFFCRKKGSRVLVMWEDQAGEWHSEEFRSPWRRSS